jgi:hypothetical protein
MANNYCRDAPSSSSVCLRKLGIAKAEDVPLAPCLSSRNFGTEKNAEVLWRATSILSEYGPAAVLPHKADVKFTAT